MAVVIVVVVFALLVLGLSMDRRARKRRSSTVGERELSRRLRNVHDGVGNRQYLGNVRDKTTQNRL